MALTVVPCSVVARIIRLPPTTQNARVCTTHHGWFAPDMFSQNVGVHFRNRWCNIRNPTCRPDAAVSQYSRPQISRGCSMQHGNIEHVSRATPAHRCRVKLLSPAIAKLRKGCFVYLCMTLTHEIGCVCCLIFAPGGLYRSTFVQVRFKRNWLRKANTSSGSVA